MTSRTSKLVGKQDPQREGKEKKAQSASDQVEPSKENEAMDLAAIIRELKELRKENQESFTDTKASLARLETSVTDVKQRLESLEQRTTEAESRISASEDAGFRHDRAIRYLLKREATLTTICDDLQNRLRRNNLRIYQVLEDTEKEDMVGFVKQLIKTTLRLPDNLNLQIERAHRSLGSKPAPSAPPRSIIVRFLDYTVKEATLRQAWSQKQVMFQGKPIYFDQDYSPDVQKKRAKVREVIKQLKEKGVQARCRFPAQLRVNLDSGVKTFPSLVEALPTLNKLGISVQVSEREKLEQRLISEAWQMQRNGRRGGEGAALSEADMRAFLS